MNRKIAIGITVLTTALSACMVQECFAADEADTLWDLQRKKLVDQLSKEGIEDSRVLDAMTMVPRHEFVPEYWREFSYEDRPLPIGGSQTISQPFIVAYMCQEARLKPTDKVLEIGTGSGYHAAVMSLLCREVKTIEIVAGLGLKAERLLKAIGYANIEVMIGDGYAGWVDEAPFDVIVLTAAPVKIPTPLKEQLRVGGKLIAPVGKNFQELMLYEKTESGITSRSLIPVRFVPMIGKALENE